MGGVLSGNLLCVHECWNEQRRLVWLARTVPRKRHADQVATPGYSSSATVVHRRWPAEDRYSIVAAVAAAAKVAVAVGVVAMGVVHLLREYWLAGPWLDGTDCVASFVMPDWWHAWRFR